MSKVSEKIIPHQWKILNDQLEDTKPTYCIQNFRIAAGELEGERKGVVFRDTDLYKWLETTAFCLSGGYGKEYEPLADEVIGLIGRAQEPNYFVEEMARLGKPEFFPELLGYDLPNATNYSETCASIGLMIVGQRLASATGDASYYDVVERALYNTVLAGINMKGDRYFYVNPLEVVPEFCTQHTYMDHVKPVRQKWFGVACCPPNVARTLASLGQYICAQDEEAFYIHQFISSSAQTVIRGNKLKAEMESGLMQNGKVEITVDAQTEGILKVRVPYYVEEFVCMVDVEVFEREVENHYLIIPLKAGRNEILLDLNVRPRWVAANDSVRADAEKAVLMKGPMVYCLEEADNGDLLSQVYVEENASVNEAETEASLAGGIPALTYRGIRLSNRGAKGCLYGRLELEKKEVKC